MTEEKIKQEVLEDMKIEGIIIDYPQEIFKLEHIKRAIDLATAKCKEEFEKEKLKADVEKANLFEGGQKFEHQKIIDIIKNFENPYPKDIFTWDNKEEITDTRGKYNKMFHTIVENTKEDLIKMILEEIGGKK